MTTILTLPIAERYAALGRDVHGVLFSDLERQLYKLIAASDQAHGKGYAYVNDYEEVFGDNETFTGFGPEDMHFPGFSVVFATKWHFTGALAHLHYGDDDAFREIVDAILERRTGSGVSTMEWGDEDDKHFVIWDAAKWSPFRADVNKDEELTLRRMWDAYGPNDPLGEPTSPI